MCVCWGGGEEGEVFKLFLNVNLLIILNFFICFKNKMGNNFFKKLFVK